jgi:hypothetical protein
MSGDDDLLQPRVDFGVCLYRIAGRGLGAAEGIERFLRGYVTRAFESFA